MLIGEFRHTVDAKRRLAVPAKFRKKLGSKVVAAKGLEGSLFLYPIEEWQEMAERLTALPVGKSENRSFVRTMLAGAVELEIDNLGRILLPEYLVDYASIKKNLVVLGLYKRIEIWDEKKWEEYKKKSEGQTDDIAEKLGDIGAY